MELKKVTSLAWRRFLSSEAGIEGMLYLRENTPKIGRGAPHEIQYDAGVNQGYVMCLDTIPQVLAIEQTKDVDPSND